MVLCKFGKHELISITFPYCELFGKVNAVFNATFC